MSLSRKQAFPLTGKLLLMHNWAVKIRGRLLKCTILIMLLIFGCNLANAQSTADAISARLKGQPLYLRGCWGKNDLKFEADGQPEKSYKIVPFTEAGIEVQSVKALSGGRLRIEGPRVGLVFTGGSAHRISLHSGSIKIEIQAPPDGDFSKALDAIFAPDLASMVPAMPDFWQDYAREHLLPPSDEGGQAISSVASDTPTVKAASARKYGGGGVTKPTVISTVIPKYSDAARALKLSGNVEVFLWVLEDGSTSHLRVVKPAGLGLDEQAILAVSKYRFKPAMRDGRPVKVDLYVNVNFQIF